MPRKGYKTITITEELYAAHLEIYEKNITYWRRQGITSFSAYISRILSKQLIEDEEHNPLV
jgi:predicted CopG family antitoxin